MNTGSTQFETPIRNAIEAVFSVAQAALNGALIAQLIINPSLQRL
jgi:hypothetical protein